ncbi:hypothetical protein BVRB_3g060540 [Beta vulgaris subsp. vulgaris]|nr:hypothetical protein BVRB_3g060540 [Beta vulgaris subsp. vulgaris]
MDAVSSYAVVPFISGLFNVLLDRLAPENIREYLMGSHSDSTATELWKLRTSMIRVRRVINDAEEKQDTDPDVKSWVNEVKHAVYDAEDLLDEIHTKTLVKRVESETSSQVMSSITATFGRMVAALDPFHQGTISKIHMINKRFEGFSQLIDVLNLKSGLEKPRLLSSSRLTSSLVDESMICGRDSEKELFIQLLKDGVPKTDKHGSLIKGSRFPDCSIRTFAIIGMPGIGKTTLAQLIFNDPRVDDIFQFKSWTCVPEVSNVINIMKSILSTPFDPNQHFEDLESNQTCLRKRVCKQRILIVLDDVGDENMISTGWHALLISLKSAAPGSTIIVTTSNEGIAKMFRPFYTHLLHELSHDDCWTLFKMHAFGDPLAAPDVKLEATGRQLVAKCGGLPLAVKAVGCLLSFTLDAKEWEFIESSNLWDLPSYFVASDSHGSSIRELGELSQLRGSLRISGLENIVAEADAYAANLMDKGHLDELVFMQHDECSVADRQHEQLMHALKPHTNLVRLTIDFYEGKKFPDWVGNDTFCNLEVLHLKQCTNCVELPSLGQLPLLKHLLIKGFHKLETLGARFYGQHSATSSPFKSLLTLKFEGLQQLKKWCMFEGNASPFPCLVELSVKDCGELEGDLPLELPSLMSLSIWGCRKLSGILSNAPLLRELCLIAFGRIDVMSIARFTHLTNLFVEQVQDDLVAKVQEAIRDLTSLGNLSISTEGRGTIALQPWNLPASVRSIRVYTDEQIIFNGASQLQYLFLLYISSPLRFPAGYFQLLHFLEISTCDGLTEFPIVLDGADTGFTSLHDLSISKCNRLVSFPAEGFLAPYLTTLAIYGCSSLQSPPNNMPTNFPCLRCLSFENCVQLELLPEDDFSLPLLLTFRIAGCHKLQTLPEALSSCMSLEWLNIESCTALASFPASGLPAHLQRLRIYNCEILTSLPDRLCSTLKHLDIWKCPKLESFPPSGLPPSLESMQIFGCGQLTQKYADWKLGGLSFLRELSIGGLVNVESFPADGSMPTKLNILKLDQFSRLRSVNCKELQRIITLREFEIQRCPALVLFSDDLPQSLCRLTIRQSLSMVKRCLGPDGYYVDKISHITCLELDS